ncbi:hypothetical protein ACF3NG_05300 [Aerococcaceae bacterium WGS1372]
MRVNCQSLSAFDVFNQVGSENLLEDNRLMPEDVEGAIVHKPIFPENYNKIDRKSMPENGVDKGYTRDSLTVNGYEFVYENLRENLGYGDDFDYMNEVLVQNKVAYVGNNNINTFFGHYYDLTGDGVFNPLVDQNLLEVGYEVVITDENGLSKGYQISQTLEFLHGDQHLQFYGDDYIPGLAYYGNGDDMVYIQYCRWDIQNGLLITNIGYRVW